MTGWINWLDPAARQTLVDNALEKVGREDRWSETFTDGAILHFLRNLRRDRILVSLPFGNRWSRVPDHVRGDFDRLMRQLIEKEYTILYDADALDADWVEWLVPADRRIGISSRGIPARSFQSKRGLVLGMTNVFLRMQAFAMAHEVIATPRSVMSSALITWGAAKHVFSPKMHVKKPPKPEKDDEKGCRLSQGFSVIENLPEKFWRSIGLGGSLDFDLRQLIESMETVEIIQILQLADEMVAVENLLDTQPARPRAVVFGWSQDHEAFRGVVKAMTRRLVDKGFTVATGGSGGYMRVANQEAQAARGFSVGIPLVGLQRLSSEQVVYREHHDLTVATTSYGTRIPGLLHGQDVIAVVPGASGTNQEVAAALLYLEQSPNNRRIVFAHGGYYGATHEWLQRYWLPGPIRWSTQLLNNEEEIWKWTP